MSEKKVIDRSASDNEYLHKDFHGAMCYAIKYLDEHHGRAATEAYLRRVGETVYAPLIERLKQDGLPALESHWRRVFSLEDGRFDLRYENDVLILDVLECPAIAHLKSQNMLYTDRFCETTKHVNAAICQAAGYRCRCEYEPAAGRCIQHFWKPDAQKEEDA